MADMGDNRVTRRDFVRDTGLFAAGVALSVAAAKTVQAGNPTGADTSKILNYNPTWSTAAAARPA